MRKRLVLTAGKYAGQARGVKPAGSRGRASFPSSPSSGLVTHLFSKLCFAGWLGKRHPFLRGTPHEAKLSRQVRAEAGASARERGWGRALFYD